MDGEVLFVLETRLWYRKGVWALFLFIMHLHATLHASDSANVWVRPHPIIVDNCRRVDIRISLNESTLVRHLCSNQVRRTPIDSSQVIEGNEVVLQVTLDLHWGVQPACWCDIISFNVFRWLIAQGISSKISCIRWERSSIDEKAVCFKDHVFPYIVLLEWIKQVVSPEHAIHSRDISL